MSFLVMVAIAIALALAAYYFMPKPKQPKPPGASDFEAPTADAGRPVNVIFGEVTIKGINVAGYWDTQVREYKVKA